MYFFVFLSFSVLSFSVPVLFLSCPVLSVLSWLSWLSVCLSVCLSVLFLAGGWPVNSVA